MSQMQENKPAEVQIPGNRIMTHGLQRRTGRLWGVCVCARMHTDLNTLSNAGCVHKDEDDSNSQSVHPYYQFRSGDALRSESTDERCKEGAIWKNPQKQF